MIRARDLALSSAALVVLSPVLAAISVAVRLDSPGPVIFRQQRIGRGGRPFTMHKFRTMHVGAGGPAVTAATDQRITRAGRILRATKLDELPQLYDVLRGEMALVGPRPEVAQYVQLWPGDLRPVILSVRPGITDPATSILRHEADVLARSDDPERTYVEVLLPAKARAYAEYVQKRSFWGDVAILWQTLWAVMSTERSSDREAVERWLGTSFGGSEADTRTTAAGEA